MRKVQVTGQWSATQGLVVSGREELPRPTLSAAHWVWGVCELLDSGARILAVLQVLYVCLFPQNKRPFPSDFLTFN